MEIILSHPDLIKLFTQSFPEFILGANGGRHLYTIEMLFAGKCLQSDILQKVSG